MFRQSVSRSGPLWVSTRWVPRVRLVTRGRLSVCATPIGNLGDVSERLRNTLASADVIFAEDTRRTTKLLSHLNLSVSLISLFSGNERSRTQSVVDMVRDGKSVVLVSDAGMPVVSDPGAEAIRAVRDAGYAVTVVPGPSAVSTALALSGFNADRFVFEGFLPRKGSERTVRLQALADDVRPIVIFASPNRLAQDLKDLAARCGSDREVVVARELTKLHEESWVGTLGDAVDRWPDDVKGEVTIVIGPGESSVPDIEEALMHAIVLLDEGATLSDAARRTAASTGVSRRELYERLLGRQESS